MSKGVHRVFLVKAAWFGGYFKEEREEAERSCRPGHFGSVSSLGRELQAEKPALMLNSFCAQEKGVPVFM